MIAPDRDHPADYRRGLRAERKARGICRDCPDLAVPGGSRCVACRAEHAACEQRAERKPRDQREYLRAWRARRAA